MGDPEVPVDYRFLLANERTFLAWMRTALGLIAGGVALEQFVRIDNGEGLIVAIAIAIAIANRNGGGKASGREICTSIASRRARSCCGNLLVAWASRHSGRVSRRAGRTTWRR